MRTSDIESDIKRLLASTKRRTEFDGSQPLLRCRLNTVCHYQLKTLADKLKMTPTELAEYLLEQAIKIAWHAAELGEIRVADFDAVRARLNNQESDKSERGGGAVTPDETTFSRINCIRAAFRHLGLEIGRAKDTVAIASSSDGSTRICCLTSKDYEAEKAVVEGEHYWFTIYERHLEDIQGSKQGYVALGCGSTKQILLVPVDEFSMWTEDLPPYTQGKTGWHIHLRKVYGRWTIRREGRGESPIDITKFLIEG